MIPHPKETIHSVGFLEGHSGSGDLWPDLLLSPAKVGRVVVVATHIFSTMTP